MKQYPTPRRTSRRLSLLSVALAGGWLLLAASVPLAVNLWGQQPFELPKAALVRSVVWTLAGLTLIAILCSRSSRPALRSQPLNGPLALLAFALLVTTVTAADWRLSLWGSYERAQGSLTLLSYLLLAALAALWFRRTGRARRLLQIVVVANVPLLVAGLLQGAGLDPFRLVTDARSPVYATLGRSNFLGAYLAMLLPLMLALLTTARRERSRRLWSVLLVAQLAILAMTLARSAWLAAGTGLVVYAALWWGPGLNRIGRMAAWGGAGLLALGGAGAVLLLGPGGSGSLAARFAIWRATLELIGQRPLLGYGADSLGLVFPGVFPPELVYYQGRQVFVDRAHNLGLDWLTTAGVPSLLAFLLVLGTFLWLVSRAWRRPSPRRKRAVLAGIVAALAAAVANNMVSFDVTATATLWWLLLGVGAGLAAQPAPAPASSRVMPATARGFLSGLVMVVVVAAAVWQANVRPVVADVAARQAETLAAADAWHEAAGAAQQAVLLWPDEPSHHSRLSRIYWQLALVEPESAGVWLACSEQALGAALALRPDDAALWQQSAHFYLAAAREFGRPTADAQAHQAYARALALAPRDAALYGDWGRALLDSGRAATAHPLLKRAVALDATDKAAVRALEATEALLDRHIAPEREAPATYLSVVDDVVGVVPKER